VVCPLARLRDVEQEGTHYHRSYGTKRKVTYERLTNYEFLWHWFEDPDRWK